MISLSGKYLNAITLPFEEMTFERNTFDKITFVEKAIVCPNTDYIS